MTTLTDNLEFKSLPGIAIISAYLIHVSMTAGIGMAMSVASFGMLAFIANLYILE